MIFTVCWDFAPHCALIYLLQLIFLNPVLPIMSLLVFLILLGLLNLFLITSTQLDGKNYAIGAKAVDVFLLGKSQFFCQIVYPPKDSCIGSQE